MTTVVAFARYGAVHMASDSMANVYDRPIYDITKIIVLRGDVILGFAGAGALPMLMRDKLHIEALKAEASAQDTQAWADNIARQICRLAADHLLTNTDGVFDGSAILGHNGHVWTIAHMAAIPHTDGIAAIGSGEGPAIGALDYYAMSATAGDDIECVMRTAVEIAIVRDKHSGGNIQYSCVTTPKEPIMGGKPSKGTPKDSRLGANKPRPKPSK